jgi:LAO/AO transport system kinase
VGFTGPPGIGKSTLISASVAELRRLGHSVGIIAVDPSSPINGGALLGDRIRMSDHAGDPGVFIRSVASRGNPGAVSSKTRGIIDVMDAAGFDMVIVETVGAGQSEMGVAELADAVVVVVAPGLGDEVQALKAGILEIADILVVNKGDLPSADALVRQLMLMLSLRAPGRGRAEIIRTSALKRSGIKELAQAVTRACAVNGRRFSKDKGRLCGLLAEAVLHQLRGELACLEEGELDALWRCHRANPRSLEYAVIAMLRRWSAQSQPAAAPGGR